MYCQMVKRLLPFILYIAEEWSFFSLHPGVIHYHDHYFLGIVGKYRKQMCLYQYSSSFTLK